MRKKRKMNRGRVVMPTDEELIEASNQFMAEQGIKGIDYHDSRYVPTYQAIESDHRVVEFHEGGVFKIYPPTWAPILFDERLNSFYQRTWLNVA